MRSADRRGGRSIERCAHGCPTRTSRLRPGLFARVTLVLNERDDALQIPEQALVPQGQDQFVFRVIDGKAALTKVAVGIRREGMVEIVEGLGPDDEVVTAGQLKIRDGAPVSRCRTRRPEPCFCPKCRSGGRCWRRSCRWSWCSASSPTTA